MIAVRELKKEDISQLINLHAEFLKDQYGRNKYSKGNFKVNKYSEYYEKIINSDRCKIFVGVDGNIVAGFSAVSINEPGFFFEFDRYGYMYDGFVSEPYRTTTLSFNLYNACEKWAKEKGCKYITAYAYNFNEKVQTCFKAKKMEPYKITYIKELI